MIDIAKRDDATMVIRNLLEAAEPIYGQGEQVEEYVIPAEEYDELTELFQNLMKKEII